MQQAAHRTVDKSPGGVPRAPFRLAETGGLEESNQILHSFNAHQLSGWIILKLPHNANDDVIIGYSMPGVAGGGEQLHLHEGGFERVHEDSDIGDLDVDNSAEDAVIASHYVLGALDSADSVVLPSPCRTEKIGRGLEFGRQQLCL